MDRENRLFLENILARIDVLMNQCTELKELVSSHLESELIQTTPPPAEDPLSPAEDPLSPAEDPLSPAEDTQPQLEDSQPLVIPEAVEAVAPSILEEPVPAESPIEIEDSIMPIFEKARRGQSASMVDKLTAKESWRTDIPGAKVSDIRSAISLNDRILFINQLFGEDPAAFKDALTSLNSMDNFDQAADYIASAHPEWDMESDTVYRFMMAVRRRLQ